MTKISEPRRRELDDAGAANLRTQTIGSLEKAFRVADALGLEPMVILVGDYD